MVVCPLTFAEGHGSAGLCPPSFVGGYAAIKQINLSVERKFSAKVFTAEIASIFI